MPSFSLPTTVRATLLVASLAALAAVTINPARMFGVGDHTPLAVEFSG